MLYCAIEIQLKTEEYYNEVYNKELCMYADQAKEFGVVRIPYLQIHRTVHSKKIVAI